jgi:hypothetical protein
LRHSGLKINSMELFYMSEPRLHPNDPAYYETNAYKRSVYIAAFSNGAAAAFNTSAMKRIALATVGLTIFGAAVAPTVAPTVFATGMAAFVAGASVASLATLWGVLKGDPQTMTFAPEPEQKRHWSYRTGKWLVLGAQVAATLSAPFVVPPQVAGPKPTAHTAAPTHQA